MSDRPDWTEATWEGRRLNQHREFLRLPLARKISIIEDLGEIVAFFAERRRAREGRPTPPAS